MAQQRLQGVPRQRYSRATRVGGVGVGGGWGRVGALNLGVRVVRHCLNGLGSGRRGLPFIPVPCLCLDELRIAGSIFGERNGRETGNSSNTQPGILSVSVSNPQTLDTQKPDRRPRPRATSADACTLRSAPVRDARLPPKTAQLEPLSASRQVGIGWHGGPDIRLNGPGRGWLLSGRGAAWGLPLHRPGLDPWTGSG